MQKETDFYFDSDPKKVWALALEALQVDYMLMHCSYGDGDGEVRAFFKHCDTREYMCIIIKCKKKELG